MNENDDPNKLYVHERLSCRTQINNRVYSFQSRIEDIQKKGLLILEPDLMGQEIGIGQEVLVRYFRQDAAYQFMSKVVVAVNNEGNNWLLLSFPARITRLQRRRYKRISLNGNIHFRSEDSGPKSETGELINFSAGGLCFRTLKKGIFSNSLDCIGHHLSIGLKLLDEKNYTGTVRITKVDQDRDNITSVLVHSMLVDISPEFREYLEKLVKKHLQNTD